MGYLITFKSSFPSASPEYMYYKHKLYIKINLKPTLSWRKVNKHDIAALIPNFRHPRKTPELNSPQLLLDFIHPSVNLDGKVYTLLLTLFLNIQLFK